jgi:hypothetical protein
MERQVWNKNIGKEVGYNIDCTIYIVIKVKVAPHIVSIIATLTL